ncbi:DNA alkylation repair protein [Clostridium sp. AL.422]|nr:MULTISPECIES: DNA alkylation repair protein [unclassified Clostridium]MDV4150512.1 DNA alkylation repair protein [Clostridium sp. AL.422]
MILDIRQELLSLCDENYREFSSKLLPGVNNILGVRLPALRKIAKSIAKSDWRSYLNNSKDEYFEEVMLDGMVIGYINDIDIDEILNLIRNYVPKINNWSVCDSFCNGLKITAKNKEKMWSFLEGYLSSNYEYEVRFAVVMLLNFYVDEDYVKLVLSKLDNIKNEGYYVKMAVAWAISICYVRFSEITLNYLKENNLDDFTYNKSLQKICESLKVSKEEKEIIKKMKRKLK